MSKENIVRYKAEELPETTKTDWHRLDAMTDEDIDFSEIPELDKEWFETAKVVKPELQKVISLQLDREVFDWFKAQGKGYRIRINAVLKAYVSMQKANTARTQK